MADGTHPDDTEVVIVVEFVKRSMLMKETRTPWIRFT